VAKINEQLSIDDNKLLDFTDEDYQEYLNSRHIIKNDRLEENSIFDASSCEEFAKSDDGQLIIHTLKDLNKR